MDREIVAASFAWASGRRDGVPIEGPDEDGFTLAVRAVEALSLEASDTPIERVQIVGAMPTLEPDDLAVALGIPTVVVAVRPGAVGELWAALDSATSDPKPGTEVVVVVDLDRAAGGPETPRLAGALALGFARRSGLRFLGSATIPTPAGDETRSPSEAILKIMGEGRGPAPDLRACSGPRRRRIPRSGPVRRRRIAVPGSRVQSNRFVGRSGQPPMGRFPSRVIRPRVSSSRCSNSWRRFPSARVRRRWGNSWRRPPSRAPPHGPPWSPSMSPRAHMSRVRPTYMSGRVGGVSPLSAAQDVAG